MKCYRWMLVLAVLVVSIIPASAQTSIIVRDNLGADALNLTCVLLNCKVTLNLGDPQGQLFLVSPNNPLLNPTLLVTDLLNVVGVVDAEVDQSLNLIAETAGPVPESLWDEIPLPYWGSTVWDGYANQPAAQIVSVQQAQNTFHVTGAGIVAMIDTGADTSHPAPVPALVPGYNFINNTANGDETGSLNQSSVALLDGTGPVELNGTTIAMLNQSSVALLDGSGSDFGHGTMTAGIVHMVAPTAKIMPLVAFSSNGTGYLSNVIRATYYAAQHGSKVISMSFSFSSSSKEMTKAINYANAKGIICVASAGNNGNNVVVYPAGNANVMGVASTSDLDTRSSFSSYGSDVWVAAPGEAIISTYPYGTYAAEWGTSFSAPFVSGTAALLAQVSPSVNQAKAAAAIANAVPLRSSGMGNGELNVFQAVQALADAQ
jgi:subtilisin family serine protease